MNADIAHKVATRPETHRAMKINEALHKFDKALKRERALAVPGYYWGTLGWAWREEARLIGVHLEAMGADQ